MINRLSHHPHHPRQHRHPRRRVGTLLCGAALLAAAASPVVAASPDGAPPTAAPTPVGAAAAPVQALPELQLSRYIGTWYQVALFPNRFQSQCVRDTTARYETLDDGTVRVRNRCTLADGRVDEAIGVARPVGRLEGDWLRPAQLTVSFLPAWLQWLPVARGAYWVIQRADDGRYAVVSEPTRTYLWVLSRTPALSAADESAIRSRLLAQGFDLSRWVPHPQTAPTGAADARPDPRP